MQGRLTRVCVCVQGRLTCACVCVCVSSPQRSSHQRSLLTQGSPLTQGKGWGRSPPISRVVRPSSLGSLLTRGGSGLFSPEVLLHPESLTIPGISPYPGVAVCSCVCAVCAPVCCVCCVCVCCVYALVCVQCAVCARMYVLCVLCVLMCVQCVSCMCCVCALVCLFIVCVCCVCVAAAALPWGEALLEVCAMWQQFLQEVLISAKRDLTSSCF